MKLVFFLCLASFTSALVFKREEATTTTEKPISDVATNSTNLNQKEMSFVDYMVSVLRGINSFFGNHRPFEYTYTQYKLSVK
ncbi:hypothetical protein Ciccas_002005 [Cichlidogyrus casuarinus]|uniref:Uncharacterized protein n=1 Tax=Cichlidogyrus casuarinus TaxID=1844966 RepID=A0ABD2QIF3_9PLAT